MKVTDRSSLKMMSFRKTYAGMVRDSGVEYAENAGTVLDCYQAEQLKAVKKDTYVSRHPITSES